MTAIATTTQPAIIAGVDAHKDTHHVVVLTISGNKIADREFPTTSKGYRELLDWVASFGLIEAFGMESTGSYSAGLTRFLLEQSIDVREVNTPHPHTKARRGKDDAIDAEAAARKVLAGEATARPKVTTGAVESIRMLTLARDSGVKARATALVQLQDILITAPVQVREQITSRTSRGKASQCRKFRPDTSALADPVQAAKFTLRSLARRIDDLDDQITCLEAELASLVQSTAPTMLTRVGIGNGHAAQLLITAGQNIDRLHSEAAFARLCGVAPIPVSSGRTHRMRLHRGGDRQANRALHMIAVCRLRYDDRTKIYMERRLAEGLSKKDVLRCLKRFIAREVFNDLKADLDLT